MVFVCLFAVNHLFPHSLLWPEHITQITQLLILTVFPGTVGTLSVETESLKLFT